MRERGERERERERERKRASDRGREEGGRERRRIGELNGSRPRALKQLISPGARAVRTARSRYISRACIRTNTRTVKEERGCS